MKTLKEEIQHIDIGDIVPDENQPRKYFDPVKMKNIKSSITRLGVMNPLTVEKIGNKYLIVDGERRYRAATELKLKELPCIVIAPQSALERRLQQFHIQEQHESWTATEKAVAVNDIAQDLEISVKDLAEMIGADPRTTSKYLAFSTLLERKDFVKYEIGLDWAPTIINMCNTCENLYREYLKEPFTNDLKKKLERAIMAQIRQGEVTKPSQLSRLRDSFVKSPKDIIKFLNDGATVTEMFLNTKAQGAYHLRNVSNNAGYVSTHLKKYLENPDIKPTESQIKKIKAAKDDISEFLKKIEE